MRWRKDRAASDPMPYARRNDGAVWCSVNQNDGWYYVRDGDVFPEGNPFFNVAKWIGKQQMEKMT